MEQDFDMLVQQEPSLTLDPFAEEKQPQEEEPLAKAEQPEPVEVVLTPEEQKMVDEFAAKIDLANSNMVLQYGAGAQKKIADFSDSALEHMKTKDLGEIGQMLIDVVGELKTLDVEEEKGIFSVFRKNGNRLANMKAKYEKAEANVNKICKVLEGHQIQLLKDVATMDRMYEINLSYLKELSMYILAGKKKLKEAMEQDVPTAVEKARRTGLPEDTQAANDLANRCNRFEKKLHDLELTRMVSLQLSLIHI